VPGKGEPGVSAGPAGDLFVRVHVSPHAVFGRSGNDLTLTVPVTFPELAMGTTLTVPTLDDDRRVSLKVAAGTPSGRILRVRGRGIARRDGRTGDLLVTVQVAVPSKLSDKAATALTNFADATKDQDPRAELNRLLDHGGAG
jgi:molecular chaperone DnaJ